MSEPETAETRLRETSCVVEATDNEQFNLWSEWSKESLHPRVGLSQRLDWRQIDGWLVCVGELAGFPVNTSMMWCRINGHLVMFWHPCSRVVDHKLIEDWIDSKFDQTDSGRKVDAANFHNCIPHLEAAISPTTSPKKSAQNRPVAVGDSAVMPHND